VAAGFGIFMSLSLPTRLAHPPDIAGRLLAIPATYFRIYAKVFLYFRDTVT
jgi:hypothetical protein